MKTPLMSHPPRRIAALALALAFGCAGCELLGLSDPEPASPPPTAPKVAPKAPPVEPVEQAAPQDERRYQRPEYPENMRRNPFQPDPEAIAPNMITGVSDTVERQRDPLEQFSLDQLQLVAIISEVSVPKAMFIDPEGYGHVAKIGDRIGRQGGVIVDVRDNQVDVRENSGDVEDASSSRVRTMRLRDLELRAQEDGGLSDAERAALERLLNTEEGRRALQQSVQDRSLGASAVDGQSPGANVPASEGGIAPPR